MALTSILKTSFTIVSSPAAVCAFVLLMEFQVQFWMVRNATQGWHADLRGLVDVVRIEWPSAALRSPRQLPIAQSVVGIILLLP